MKEFYHGTVDTYLPEIMAKGLMPNIQNKWDMNFSTGFNPKQDDTPGYVYLTPAIEKAIRYANGRAKYLHMLPGVGFGIVGLVSNLVKNATAPVEPNAKPVVLKVLLPENFTLEPDPQDWFSAYRHYGPISPERIVQTIPITEDKQEPVEFEPVHPTYQELLDVIQSIQGKRGLR